MNPKAIVLLSGGIDSATAMWKVKDNYSHFYALTFSYGAKDEAVALKVSKRLAELAGAEHMVIALPWLEEFSRTSGSSLVADEDVPEVKEMDLDNLEKAKITAKDVWIPARNLVFLSIAASFAEALGGGADIIAGFDREEASTFPDNSVEFVEQVNRLLEFAVLEKNIRVTVPLIHMNKDEIAGLAVELGVPVEYTSSCYNPAGLDEKGRPMHCGRCESCVRRKRGLKATGKDKTIYEK